MLGKPRGRRPSPAMVVALISLFVALGGVGYAAATIGSAQIKNNSVKSTDIKNNSLLGKDIRNSTIKSRDVGRNALTGSDINESKLGVVPSAGSAKQASTAGSVAGITARKINFHASNPTAATEVLNLGGLVLKASCGAGLNVIATTLASNAQIRVLGSDVTTNNDTDNQNHADNFDTGQTFDVLGGTPTDTYPQLIDSSPADNVGELRYRSEAGSVVTIDFSSQQGGTGPVCDFFGIALGG